MTTQSLSLQKVDYIKAMNQSDQGHFIDLLILNDINEYQEFEDRMYYITDTDTVEEAVQEFGEFLYINVLQHTILEDLEIDWQSTWTNNLSEDFAHVRYDGSSYFFLKR